MGQGIPDGVRGGTKSQGECTSTRGRNTPPGRNRGQVPTPLHLGFWSPTPQAYEVAGRTPRKTPRCHTTTARSTPNLAPRMLYQPPIPHPNWRGTRPLPPNDGTYEVTGEAMTRPRRNGGRLTRFDANDTENTSANVITRSNSSLREAHRLGRCKQGDWAEEVEGEMGFATTGVSTYHLTTRPNPPALPSFCTPNQPTTPQSPSNVPPLHQLQHHHPARQQTPTPPLRPYKPAPQRRVPVVPGRPQRPTTS